MVLLVGMANGPPTVLLVGMAVTTTNGPLLLTAPLVVASPVQCVTSLLNDEPVGKRDGPPVFRDTALLVDTLVTALLVDTVEGGAIVNGLVSFLGCNAYHLLTGPGIKPPGPFYFYAS